MEYWVTSPTRWGPGKIHAPGCRWTDPEVAPGYWCEEEQIQRADQLGPIVDCKSCGGTGTRPARKGS